MDENIVFEENEFEYAEDFAPSQAYHASIQSEIDGINAPVETKDTLGKANEGLKSHMERFQEAEKIYGPYPEVWNSFEPQRREITANIRNVGQQYQNNATDEAKAEATERAVFSINASSDYFIKQHEILLKREELHLKEMQEIRQQLQDMQQLLNNSQNLTVGAAFLQAAETLRKAAHNLKDRTVGKAYKNARNAVHEVHDRIVNAPAELRDAVNQKVTETRDRAVTAVVNKVTGIFKKGISFLEKISNKVAAMAPQEQVQEDFGRNLSDLALPVGVLAVKPSLTPNEKEILTSFYISERDRLEEGFMNTLGKSKILMEEEGNILRDTVNVMIKDGLSNDRIKMIMANMPFNKDRMEVNRDNVGFVLNSYLESDIVKQYREDCRVAGFGRNSAFNRPDYLPLSAIQSAKRKEMVDMVKAANIPELEKKLVAANDERIRANDEKRRNTATYGPQDISKLAKTDKLTPKEMEYLIDYYQMRNNQLEASFLDKASDNKLTKQELGFIKKDLADIMLKDGMSDSRISIISNKMTSRHPVVPSPELRPKDEFNLRAYLKSDEAKRIRQSGLAEREKVTKKAAVR